MLSPGHALSFIAAGEGISCSLLYATFLPVFVYVQLIG